MKAVLNPLTDLERPLYHFSFLKDIKVHGIYFNSITKFFNLYCAARKEHSNDFYSVILFTKGAGNIAVNNDRYQVHAKTLCIIGPHQVHSFDGLIDAEGYVFFFCQDFYVEEFSFIRLLNAFAYTSLTATKVGIPCIDLTDDEFFSFRSLLNSIQNEYESYKHSNNSAIIIRSQLNILIMKLTELYESKSGKTNNNDSIVIHTLSNLVDSYFIKEQQLGFYTSAFNMSESQLNDICNKHFNSGLKKILQNRLMQEARKLLLSSELSISEIAFKLNFEDNSYFCKVFKNKTGLTPKRFRDIHKRLVPQKS